MYFVLQCTIKIRMYCTPVKCTLHTWSNFKWTDFFTVGWCVHTPFLFIITDIFLWIFSFIMVWLENIKNIPINMEYIVVNRKNHNFFEKSAFFAHFLKLRKLHADLDYFLKFWFLSFFSSLLFFIFFCLV